MAVSMKTPVALKPYGQSERNKVKATQEHNRLLGRQNKEWQERGVCSGDPQWRGGDGSVGG